jgi:hypothetical protein
MVECEDFVGDGVENGAGGTAGTEKNGGADFLSLLSIIISRCAKNP